MAGSVIMNNQEGITVAFDEYRDRTFLKYKT
jgi:hypothetical protein